MSQGRRWGGLAFYLYFIGMPRIGWIALLCCLAASACDTPFTLKDGYARVGRFHVHYRETGVGAPIVFLHAGYQDTHMWDGQISLLARQYRVILIDLPGHGLTTGRDTTMPIAEWINTLMDSLHVAPATFVGLSLGAICATDFALAHPAKVTQLVLASPGMTGWRSVMSLDSLSLHLFASGDSAEQTGDKRLYAKRFTEIWCVGPYRSYKQVDSSVTGYVYRTTLNSLGHHNRKDWPDLDTLGDALRLHQVRVPTLIIVGEMDLPFIRDAAAYMAQHIQRSRLVRIPSAAHMLNLETPQIFNQQLNTFLMEKKEGLP
jgi:pimeloyl-ACP methyl ester carboxylesterase